MKNYKRNWNKFERGPNYLAQEQKFLSKSAQKKKKKKNKKQKTKNKNFKRNLWVLISLTGEIFSFWIEDLGLNPTYT